MRAADGGVIETWSDVTTVHASIEPKGGREFFNAAAVAADVTHAIRIRNYDALTTSHRLKFGTRIFNINSVLRSNEIKHLMEVQVTEVV
jgi:SPP1 family predicted phage head-tail adaptor